MAKVVNFLILLLIFVFDPLAIALILITNRVFEIENCVEYHKQNMKSFIENIKANITTRNFPETVESIKKKWKIKDGGNLYCFFTTDLNNNKIVLLCNKLN
jgi:hypothetical protein